MIIHNNNNNVIYLTIFHFNFIYSISFKYNTLKTISMCETIVCDHHEFPTKICRVRELKNMFAVILLKSTIYYRRLDLLRIHIILTQTF